MLSTSFAIPAAELPLVEKSIGQCPAMSLVGVTAFSVDSEHYYDLFLTHQDTHDIYQLGCLVGRELEQLEGGQPA